MKLIHRFGYYLGGFAIGLIILAFFLSGKNVSCAYGPNARTIKNISLKERFFSDAAVRTMNSYNIDTLAISTLIKTGNVNFSKSDTKSEGCKTYIIENEWQDKDLELQVKNCDSTATIETLIIK